MQAAVEVGAGDVNAVVGEHVGRAVDARVAIGGEADHREVGGAAADVHHQHRLLPRDASLVVEGRGDGLQLELDVAKACVARARLERGLRLRVACRIVVDEAHRPPEHHGAQFDARVFLRPFAQHAQVEREDVGEGKTPVAHRRALVHEPAAEDALERAHEPSRRSVEIIAHRRAAVAHVHARVGGKEDGARQRRLGVLHGCKRHRARSHERDTRVGRAEVEAAGAHRAPVRLPASASTSARSRGVTSRPPAYTMEMGSAGGRYAFMTSTSAPLASASSAM